MINPKMIFKIGIAIKNEFVMYMRKIHQLKIFKS